MTGDERRVVRVRGRGDEQVHRVRRRLPAGAGDRRREVAVAAGHGSIDGQGAEEVLDQREAPEALGAQLGIVGGQHTEVQLGDRDRAHRELAGELGDLGRDEHAGVEDRSGQISHTSSVDSSMRSRSVVHSGSAGPEKIDATSS